MSNIFQNLFDNFNPYFIPAALICITVHESAHGFVASRLGDPTAVSKGRVSLNPLRHIDPIGLFMLMVVGFGWAKPVPVDIRYFRKPKRDMALTALAGPMSNFLLAYLAVMLYAVMVFFAPDSTFSDIVRNTFLYTAVVSVGLGLFNLIPISPLDGSKIIALVLPDNIYYRLLRYERYGFIVLLVIMYMGAFNGILYDARQWVINGMWTLASAPIRVLAGGLF